MKYKKGFSLIETIVVLALISILGIVIITNISKYKDKSSLREEQKKIDLIISAANSYVTNDEDKHNELYLKNANVNMSVEELIDNGYLDDSFNKYNNIKLTALLDEKENVLIKYDTTYNSYISFAFVKDIVKVDQTVDLLDGVELHDDVDNLIEVINHLEITSIDGININDNKFIVPKLGNNEKAKTLTFKYTYTIGEEEIIRYRYYYVYSGVCNITLNNTSEYKVVNNIKYSNKTSFNYNIESPSGTIFYATENKLKDLSQLVKSVKNSGVINFKNVDNPSYQPKYVYGYCFNDSGTRIGNDLDSKSNELVYIDLEAPKCDSNSIKILALEGNNGWYRGSKKNDGNDLNLASGIGAYTDNSSSLARYYISTDSNAITNDSIFLSSYPYQFVPSNINNWNNTNSYGIKVSYNNVDGITSTNGANYYLHIMDYAGNSTTCMKNIKYDRIAPVISAKSNYKKNYYIGDVFNIDDFIEYSDLGSGIDRIETYINGVKISSPSVSSFKDQNNEIYFVAIDIAGNVTKSSIFNIKMYRYLNQILYYKNTCKAEGVDCYVYNDRSNENYVYFAGKMFRAYYVNYNNNNTVNGYTKLITSDNTNYGMFGLYELSYNCCPCGGCIVNKCLYKYYNQVIHVKNYLSSTFYNELSRQLPNINSYLTSTIYNNSPSNNSVNKTFKLKIGLISQKEYSIVANCSGYNCENTYLNNNSNYWTFTPLNSEGVNSYSLENAASYIIVNSSGNLSYSYNHSNYRPVISILPNILVTSGDGTISNPYRLGV